MSPDDNALVALLHEAADAVHDALAKVTDWHAPGERPDQYGLDLAADAAALAVLERAGVGVLSEESGLHRPEADIVVVIDPVDGSTNASLQLPWYATSLCALDRDGPRAALVVNQASGTRFSAVRGAGAFRDGLPIRPSTCASLADAVVGVNGYDAPALGWRQFRRLGAAALELCAVACGQLDAYVDLTSGQLAVWDYMGALLVCQEAGASIGDVYGAPLIVRSVSERRAIVAGATSALYEALRDARLDCDADH